MSGDEKLIEAYRQAEDIHRITASQVFHVPLEEVTPAAETECKGGELWDRIRDQFFRT